MPGRRKEPTREDRAMNADEVESKISDAAGSIYAVVDGIDEEYPMDDRPTRSEIECLTTEGARATRELAALAERLGYRGMQLQLPNRAMLTSITDMLEDNPGLVEAIYAWIADNLADEDPDDEDEEENDEDE